MHASAKQEDDWMFDEPTVTEEEREAELRELVVANEAKLLRAALPITCALVVARGPNVPTGAVVRSDNVACASELDPVMLAEILAAADDDAAVATAARLILGSGATIEHWVGRARDGSIASVVAVAVGSRVERRWLRVVLARAADSVAAWLGNAPRPPIVALLAATKEPTIVHDDGVVVLANPAATRLLGRDADELVGIRVARIVDRVAIKRSCWLLVGSHMREALVLDGSTSADTECSLTSVVDALVARSYSVVRQTAQLAFDRREDSIVAAPAARVEELAELALLDATALFTGWSQKNRIQIAVYRDAGRAVLEVSAAGTLGPNVDGSSAPPSGGAARSGTAGPCGAEHLGVVTCAGRTRSLGGAFLVDTSYPGRRIVRISLPVAS